MFDKKRQRFGASGSAARSAGRQAKDENRLKPVFANPTLYKIRDTHLSLKPPSCECDQEFGCGKLSLRPRLLNELLRFYAPV